MLTGRQIMFHIFSFFNINETQVHTMNSSELLLVELYNDNVKIFNHASEETMLALVVDLDEHVLENLYERQANKFTLMKSAMTLFHQDVLVQKNQQATTDLRSMVKDILQQQQQQKMLISQNERARDRAAAAYSLKGPEEKGKYLRSLDIKKARAGKAENVLSNLSLQIKGKTKEIDQGAQVQETIPQKDNIPQRQEEDQEEEDFSVFQPRKRKL